MTTSNFFHDHETQARCVMCDARTHGRVRVDMGHAPLCGACYLQDWFNPNDVEHLDIGAPSSTSVRFADRE